MEVTPAKKKYRFASISSNRSSIGDTLQDHSADGKVNTIKKNGIEILSSTKVVGTKDLGDSVEIIEQLKPIIDHQKNYLDNPHYFDFFGFGR